MTTEATQQPPASQQQAPAPAAAPAAAQNGSSKSKCPPHVLEAIYGKQANKKEALENSLRRWWTEYADRKNDDEEYVADSLLYDRRHLPRTAPAPDCVMRPTAPGAAAAPAPAAAQQQQPAAQQPTAPQHPPSS